MSMQSTGGDYLRPPFSLPQLIFGLFSPHLCSFNAVFSTPPISSGFIRDTFDIKLSQKAFLNASDKRETNFPLTTEKPKF